MKKRNEIKIKEVVFVLSFILVFALPSMSLATSFSDVDTGKAGNILDNTQQMSHDRRFFTDSHNNGNLDNNGHNKRNRVSNTPIPPAAWLLGTGLIGLIGIRRRMLKKKGSDSESRQ